MKKKKIIVLGVIFVLLYAVFCGVVLWWKADVSFLESVDVEDIKSVSVFDGASGQKISIEDSEDIKYIVESVQGATLKKSGYARNVDGFAFRLSFIDLEGNEIETFIINANDTIRGEWFFYEDSEESLPFDRLQEIVRKST